MKSTLGDNHFFFLRSYGKPDVDPKRIQESCDALHVAVQQGLKNSGVDVKVYVPFQLDVWRHLTSNKQSVTGAYLFEKNDFSSFILPLHWYYTLNEHGQGVRVDFPVKIRPFLAKGNSKAYVVDGEGQLQPSPRLYTEMSVYFVIRACNIGNLL